VGQVSDQQIGAFHSGKSIGPIQPATTATFVFLPETEQMMQTTISFRFPLEFEKKKAERWIFER
jgi:hypothetical protein